MTHDGRQARPRSEPGIGSFYVGANMDWPHLIENALRAHVVYEKDKDTSSQDDEIIIVDEFTGRLMHGRQWSDGLHQAVEAKEGVTGQGGDADPRHDHHAELLQAVQAARGHDRHGHDRSRRVHEDLQARGRAIPTNRPVRPRRLQRQDLPDRRAQVRRDRRGNPGVFGRTGIRPTPGRCWTC